jgi:hypothetical protein
LAGEVITSEVESEEEASEKRHIEEVLRILGKGNE